MSRGYYNIINFNLYFLYRNLYVKSVKLTEYFIDIF